MLAQNKYYSYNSGELPGGCQYCVRGEKLVLFVTGICPRTCYFCPVSDQKYQQDVIFANERPVKREEDLLKETRLMQAHGAGITGGDPLAKLDRTVLYIILLKKEHGKEFHIHLYTSLNLVTTKALQRLSEAGLDEIRFHLDLDDTRFWERLRLARQFSWKIGVELPLLSAKEKEIQVVIDFIQDKVDFLVLNELEVADNSQSKLLQMGCRTKDATSYAIQGSAETGLRLLEYVKQKEYPLAVHLCTAKLKDAVQLGNRLKREAQGVRRSFDQVDKEGLLTRGGLYLPELAPGFGYRKKLSEVPKELFIKRLEPLLKKIKEELSVKEQDIFLDKEKPRILLSQKMLKKHKKYCFKLGLLPAIVKEYPTADQLEIEVEFIKG